MAAITAAMVKELREMTGAGMMDCKKALTETDGNIDAAVDVLKKSGAAKMEKKASRIAAEGIAKVAKNGNTAVVVEVNSETDFVAKNAVFQDFVQEVAEKALTVSVEKAGDGEDLLTILDMKEVVAEKTLSIGEKLSIRRFEKVTGDCVASYIHGGGRIGVLVAGMGASDDAAAEALTNVAMQVAAMNPQYISKNDISADELAKIKDITLESSLNDPFSLPRPILTKLIDKAITTKAWNDEVAAIYTEKKNDKEFNMNYLPNFIPDEAKAALAQIALADKAEIGADRMFAGAVEGRVSKQLKEICLMDQIYVKAEDGKQSVSAYLASVNKALTISKVIRYEVGEGMEKRNEDFAAEVAKQMGQ